MSITEKCEFQKAIEIRVMKLFEKYSVIPQNNLKLLTEAIKERESYGDCNCCTLAFIIYICFFCKNINGLIEELRSLFTEDFQDALGNSKLKSE